MGVVRFLLYFFVFLFAVRVIRNLVAFITTASRKNVGRKKEGETTLVYNPEELNREKGKLGEYVDFEEVKEK